MAVLRRQMLLLFPSIPQGISMPVIIALVLLAHDASAEEEDDMRSSGAHAHNGDSDSDNQQHNNHGAHRGSLTDVLLCLVLALGWTVWMINSLVRQRSRASMVGQFSTAAVVVRGNVRQVTRVIDGATGDAGGGVGGGGSGHTLEGSSDDHGLLLPPTYQAIIDYTIDCSDETIKDNGNSGSAAAASQNNDPDDAAAAETTPRVSHISATATATTTTTTTATSAVPPDDSSRKQIQIRKQFETNQTLEEGFANVELLVLPTEPTMSVLKEDFETVLLAQQQQQHSADASSETDSTSLFPTTSEVCCCGPDVGTRLSVALAAILVIVSIAGAVLVVENLDDDFEMDDGPGGSDNNNNNNKNMDGSTTASDLWADGLEHHRKIWGWIIVGVGVPALLPLALLWLKIDSAVRQSLRDPQRAGIVLRGAEHVFRKLECGAAEDMHSMLEEAAANRPHYTLNNHHSHRQYKTADDSTVGAAGCYFVHLPPRRNFGNRNTNNNNSNLSTNDSFSIVSEMSSSSSAAKQQHLLS